MTFGYKIMDSIHQTFGTPLIVLSLENLLCRVSGFSPQALQELLDVCLSRNSSTDNGWVLEVQKLSQRNLAAPVPIASIIRNAPFFPFSGSCSVPGSAHKSSQKEG